MELTSIIEALVFSSKSALSTKVIANSIREAGKAADADEEAAEHAKVKTADVEEAIADLIESYEIAGRSFTLAERPGGWRLCALPLYAPWVRQLFPDPKPSRLSPPALETLAIIAYRQPVTKASMEAVRGVAVDGVLQKLIDKHLVRIAGRADLPGRPLLYGTTDSFLEKFGIRDLDDLPNSAELRQVQLPEPELPGIDTPAEEQLSMGSLAEPDGENAHSELESDRELESKESSSDTTEEAHENETADNEDVVKEDVEQEAGFPSEQEQEVEQAPLDPQMMEDREGEE